MPLKHSTMSHPSWLPPKSSAEPLGHVSARMETTHSFGTPSISVSTQQPPKKFAPVVAPKPKYNPYKQPGGEGDFLPPPPPPLDDSSTSPSGSGNFPPPPPLDDSAFRAQGNPGGKTLEERRSSLDAEIDSLTSILADLECSSPYKPRPPQFFWSLKECHSWSLTCWVKSSGWLSSGKGVSDFGNWNLVAARGASVDKEMPVPRNSGGSHTKLSIQGLWNYIAWSPILVPYLLVFEVCTTHFTFVCAAF